MSKEEQYREMFYSEAFENHEELNRLFTILEKNHEDLESIDSIFRITHTLKGNAMGLGCSEIADLTHVMEDIFGEIRQGKLQIDESLFNNLYRANDKLGELIAALKEPTRVNYKGIRTKLRVFLNKSTKTEIEKVPLEMKTSDVVVSELDTEELETVSAQKLNFSDRVQIPVLKLDNLMNLVGELIIEKDSLIAERNARSNEYSRLHRITSDLQYAVMDVRLVQVGFMFNKFHRIVRDAASIEKKKVNLTLTGTEIEIDRNVLKIMSDSLVHLVRNAVSHGIETPKDRKAMQKGVEGQVILTASNEKDMVIIKVQDDGAGMDPSLLKKKAIEKGIISKEMAEQMSKEDAYQLIFEPGFSNAREITALSGRGVGMDVVKRATESIGGKIDIKSELGKGSEITLSLPASMAVKGALLFELGSQEFAVPLSYTEAVISLDKSDIQKFNGGLISQYLDQTLSLVFLDDLFDCDDSKKMISKLHRSYDRLSSDTKLEVLLLSFGDKLLGIVVDKLLQQKEIIEKPLFKPLDQIELFSGATILGNGNVCLVLDAAYIMRYLFGQNYK